jgi:hypothetical protein
MDDTILTLLITATAGTVAIIAKLIYSSKCKVVKCCNCIEINRDTEHEQNITVQATNV